jgi:hypothetical protein
VNDQAKPGLTSWRPGTTGSGVRFRRRDGGGQGLAETTAVLAAFVKRLPRPGAAL